MPKTHYETLGIAPGARSNDIKTAYRKLALKHHPDRSSDPSAPQIFRGIAEAFEVLSDPSSRKKYDEKLAQEKRLEAERVEAQRREEQRRFQTQQATTVDHAFVEQAAPSARRPRVDPEEIRSMVNRLAAMFNLQRFGDCELLARQIINLDPRQAFPYAVLGDIARARGNLEDASKMYSYALQMDPTNAIFLRRYEEILDRSQLEEGRGHRVHVEPQERRIFAILAIAAITLLACVFLVLSPEKPFAASLGPVSTWTIGAIASLFVCGLCAGGALSAGNLLDRVDASASGRLSPSLLFGLVALISFPASAALYALVGISQRAFSITTTRMMATVASVTFCLAMGGAASAAAVSLLQVILWGGNLVYLGAMAGWAIADSVRQ